MPEHGFSLTRILLYKDKIVNSALNGECGSVKMRILAYFMECVSHCRVLSIKLNFFVDILNESLPTEHLPVQCQQQKH